MTLPQPPPLDGWRAEFQDRGTEHAFRRWSYHAAFQETRNTILMASGLFFAYALADYAKQGASTTFFHTLGLRSLGLLIGLVAVAVIHRRREITVMDVSTVAFELSVSALFGAVLTILQPHAIFAALGEVIVILGAFLFIPNRFSLTVLSGWLITGGFLLVDTTALQADADVRVHVVVVLTFAAIFGTAYSHRLHTLRRREYAKLMIEREAREELQRQIEQRKHLERQLLQLATTDPLTGVSNRRHFMDSAQREIKRSLRHGRPLSILLIDIDHFKVINDTYGHAVGDDLLVELSRVCRENLRADDIFGRVGGEEFAILTPDIAQEGAFAVAERLRTALQLPIPGSAQHMSVSIGVAEFRKEEHAIADALRRADLALYAAKHAGRNRVMNG